MNIECHQLISMCVGIPERIVQQPLAPEHLCCQHSWAVEPYWHHRHALIPYSFAVVVVAMPVALAGMPVGMHSGPVVILPPNCPSPIDLATAVGLTVIDFVARPMQRQHLSPDSLPSVMGCVLIHQLPGIKI